MKRRKSNGSKEKAREIQATRKANIRVVGDEPSSLNPNGTGLRTGPTGKPVGLNWDNRREPDPLVQKAHARLAQTRSSRSIDTRSERSEYCEAGLHLLSKHGKESKTAESGRVCEECANEKVRERNRERYAKGKTGNAVE